MNARWKSFIPLILVAACNLPSLLTATAVPTPVSSTQPDADLPEFSPHSDSTASPAAEGSDAEPDLIFYNGLIVTMDDSQPQAEAVAIRGERIVAVGTDETVRAMAGDATTLIDLDGRTVLPGLIDSHSHWIGDWSMRYASVDEAIADALANGYTTISEHFADEGRLSMLTDLDRSGALPLRVNAYLPLNWQYDRFDDWYIAYQPHKMISPHVRIGGVKVFIDSGDRNGKFLSEPYADDPNNYGEAYWNQADLNTAVREAQQAGFQVSAHTSGDAAHDLIINAYEAALNGESNSIYRHRIEHVMILRDDQLARMQAMGLLASFQLSFFHSDWTEEFESILGPERVRWVGRWRDILDAGVPAAGSTDAPWGYGRTGQSMQAIYQAVTRVGESGLPPHEWQLNQRITVQEAIELLTVDGAYASFEEDDKGSLSPGKLADLIVVSANPLSVADPADLLDIDIVLTLIGGQTVYCQPGSETICP